MSNFSEQQRTKTKRREKNLVRREKLASYLYNLSQLAFAALVLGAISPLLGSYTDAVNWITLPFGIVTTYSLTSMANRILKN